MVKQHRWLRLPNLAVAKLHLILWLLSYASQSNLVQWILHRILNHLALQHHVIRGLPGTSGIYCRHLSLRWHKSISVAKCTGLPSLCASSSTSLLFLTLYSCQAGKVFFILSHSLSIATFASDRFNAFGTGVGSWTNLHRLSKKKASKLLRTTAVGRRKECRACWSGKMARLTTCVRVVHLCRGVLTHNTMCNLLHNIAVHLFALREKRVSSVCESEKSEMKECFVPLHTAEGAPGHFQWRGHTAVSDHVPVRNHQP